MVVCKNCGDNFVDIHSHMLECRETPLLSFFRLEKKPLEPPAEEEFEEEFKKEWICLEHVKTLEEGHCPVKGCDAEKRILRCNFDELQRLKED